MNKTKLLLLLLASTCAQAAPQNDANGALIENISRFNQYEQTAMQMSSGQSSHIQIAPQEQVTSPNAMRNSTNRTSITNPNVLSSAGVPTHRPQQRATPDSSVYQSIQLLIENGNLTDKQKIKLISLLSA